MYPEIAQAEQDTQTCWYALHVRCNQERAVTRGLTCRGIFHFLPCYDSVRQWKDRRVKLQVPLFPGYLFVRIPLRQRMLVITVPNVVSLVGRGSTPTPVSQEQIDWIQRGIEHGNALPHEWLAVGRRVLIVQGPMTGLEGFWSANATATESSSPLSRLLKPSPSRSMRFNFARCRKDSVPWLRVHPCHWLRRLLAGAKREIQRSRN